MPGGVLVLCRAGKLRADPCRYTIQAIVLRMLAGLDNEAVAQIVGRSPAAVRVAAHRGLRRLAQVLSPAGVTP